jgi:hypothetical protein
MNTPEPELEAVASSLAALLRRASESSNPPNDQAARARLLRRARGDVRLPKSFNKWWLALPAAAVAAAVVLCLRLPSTLNYQVVGGTRDGAYVSAPSDHPVGVQFSDDTRVDVQAGSQLRIEDTNRRGARVFLERGRVSVHVAHHEHTRWTFAAGPCEVLVTGTRFDLKWDPLAEVFELQLREGSVEIQTPVGATPVVLRAGQDFRVDLQQRSTTTRDTRTRASAATLASAPAAAATAASLEPVAPAASAESEAVQVDPDAQPVLKSTPSAREPKNPAARSWRKLIAAGEFASVLSQADRRGSESCVHSCSAADLSALADAARYSGRTDLAFRCLHSLRARFLREPEGRSAAFLLGRSSERSGAARDARAWYERYLQESPGGGYAAEALAGKMRTTLALEGRAAATPIAEDYLRRYPTGVQAASARGILGSR